MIIAATGHRLNKLGGYDLPNPTYIQISQDTKKLLLELKPDKCISGMALGYDQWFAFICSKLGIPFIAAVPFVGQDKMWPARSKEIYAKLLNKASEVVIVSEGEYSVEKMQVRNIWMIDRCDEVMAAWNGSNGGTKNCIDYTISQNKTIHYITPMKG